MSKLWYIVLMALSLWTSQAVSPGQESVMEPSSKAPGLGPVQENKAYPLKYQKADPAEIARKISTADMPHVLLEQKVHDSTVYYYKKNRDSEDVYSAIRRGKEVYALGQVHYSKLEMDQLRAERVQALGNTYVKIDGGACGANCPVTLYVEDEQKQPQFMRFEAYTLEEDVDLDGVEEIIATAGTAAHTTVYKRQGDQVVYVDLNETVSARALWYDQKSKTFRSDGSSGIEAWTMEDNGNIITNAAQ